MEPNSPPPLLDVQNVSKYFAIGSSLFRRNKNKLQALHKVSLTINSGETLGLVGESGCGKSTLGRTIMQLYQPSSGCIQFRGLDLGKSSRQQLLRVRRHMQMIFQDPFSSLDPRMTVGAIICEPFVIQKNISAGERSAKLKILLETVGLPNDIAQRYPHEFSGGQRQRISIARAIALEPQLIIADEAVSALDVSVQSQILNLMKHLQQQQGISFLFISHNLAVVKHMSHRVAVMYLGEIVEIATANDLYRHPLHPYTQALIDAIPTLTKRQPKPPLKGDIPSPINPPKGCFFHPRCPKAFALCSQEKPHLETRSSSKVQNHRVACHLSTTV